MSLAVTSPVVRPNCMQTVYNSAYFVRVKSNKKTCDLEGSLICARTTQIIKSCWAERVHFKLYLFKALTLYRVRHQATARPGRAGRHLVHSADRTAGWPLVAMANIDRQEASLRVLYEDQFLPPPHPHRLPLPWFTWKRTRFKRV